MSASRSQIGFHSMLVAWLLMAGHATAQTSVGVPPDDAQPTYVVREYLLEDVVPTRVKGYMPMPRGMFEEKLKALRGVASSGVAGDARWISGVFYAKYKDHQLVDGRGGLDVVNKHQASSILSLSPCRLPIRQLRWSDVDDVNVTAGASLVDNNLVFVDRSSRLLFSWSLRGNAVPSAETAVTPASSTRFEIALPPSSINQLILDLPDDLVPVVAAGDVQRASDRPVDLAVVPEQVDSGFTRWLVTLGGMHEFALDVQGRQTAIAPDELTQVRQATTYRLSKSAIEVRAEISLSFSRSELSVLNLETDPALRIARVRIGTRELLPDQITQSGRPGHIELLFDEPLQGANRKLIVDAVAPLVLNQSLRLPTLRPRGLAWEQGTAVLEVPDTLVLKKLVCNDAVETRVESRADMGGGELHHFQYYDEEAACDVVIGRPSTQSVVTSGTAVAISPTTVTAQIVADIRSVNGEIYLLDALIAAPWKVDSVESSPGDALDGTPARRTRGRRIRMQLRRPVSGDGKVRVVINARRSVASARNELNAEDFRIVDFRNVAAHRRLVSLRAEAPYHLMVTGHQQPRVDPETFTEEDRELLGPLTSDYEYLDDSANGSFRVSLTQEKPRYSGTISVEAMADSDVLRQAIRIHCRPESSPVSSLVVRLAPAPDVPFTWSTDEADGVLAARLLKTTDAQDAATWEVQLRQPRTNAFHVSAVCSSPLNDAAPIFLASLVEAVDQTGTISVGAIDGTTLEVDAGNLTAIPVLRPAAVEYTFQRAAYRYDPTRDQAVTVMRKAGPRQSTLAWVWACNLVSQFESNGAASHQAQFRIQNGGRRQTEITLPAAATVHRVRVDDAEVAYAKSSGGTRKITVQLPLRQRFPLVRVEYSTQGEPLRDFVSRTEGWPQIDLECLTRTWDIWLPPGIYASEDARFVSPASTPSLAWEERLFGSALLRREGRPFDVFSLGDWQTIGRTASSDAAWTAKTFVNALANVAAASDTPDAAAGPLTWGLVLARYQRLRNSTSSGLRELWIDTDALRDQDVTDDAIYSSEEGLSVSQILVQHNLAVLAGPNSVVLTSLVRLGDFDHALHMTDHRNVFVTTCEASSWASRLERAVLADDWSGEPAGSNDPWQRVVWKDAQELGLGWRHYQLRPAAAPAVQFSVYRPAVFSATGWGVAFVMVGLVAWLSGHRRKSMALLLCALMLTLLVPPALVPVARGLLWGSSIGLLLTFWRGGAADSPRREVLPAGASISLASTGVLLLIAFGAWQVFGDEPVRGTAPQKARVHRVVIPVDEEQQPVGDFVFVPTELFNALHRRTAAATNASVTWLLRSALYEASLSLRGDAEGLVEAEVAADFEIETFQMGTSVALPLGRDGIRFITNIELDGQVVEPVWNANGEALEFSISRPGRHRLELTIRPVLRNDADSSGFALQIPAFAGARLKVRPSTRIDGIELPTTIGASERNSSLGTIDADLGPTDVLAVRWPLSSPTLVESIPLAVVENLWLRLQPSSVVVEGQFSFSVPRGGIDEVRLLVDPRLKLSQLVPSHPAKYEPEAGPTPSLVVRFDDPSEDQVLVHATFLMTETSGLGNVFLPKLHAVADVKGISTIGISMAPQLELEVVADPPLQAILPAEFLATWSNPPDAPQLAYRLTDRANHWHVSSRPRETRPVAEQQSNWSIGWTHARLHYSADVEPGGQPCFQQRLRVPPALAIDELEVLLSGAVQSVRWTRSQDVLTVFFEQAIQDRYQLTIQGRSPTSVRERTVLPLVSLQQVDLQSDRMIVRQQMDVLIESVEAIGLVEDARDGDENVQQDPATGRLFKSYLRPESAEQEVEAAFSFITKRNRPQITGQIVNRLSFQENDRWLVDARMTLAVKAGVVDELRLALPVAWSEPLTISPAVDHEIVGAGAERILVVRPQTSIRSRLNLRIRCESLRASVVTSDVPLVKLLNENQLQQYLVLQGKQGDELISWETTGLQQIQTIPNQTVPLPEDETAYRVSGTRVTAVVHNVARFGGTPQVQLADILVARNQDRTCFGVAAFDVTPLQMTECQLVVPDGMSISHVSVAGVPCTLRSPTPAGGWIPLGPEQLPQRIEVVFNGRLGANAAIPGETITAPTLADLPVEQTLWTIYGPIGAAFDEALLEHTRTNEAGQARIRVQSASLALEMAEPLTPYVPEVGFDSWKRSWEERRERAAHVLDGTRAGRDEPEADLRALSARYLEKTNVEHGHPIRFAMQGASPSVTIRFVTDRASDFGLRAGIALALAGLGILLGLVGGKNVGAGDWIEPSWHVWGVVAGILWWLWFTPSFLGLALMSAFLAAALWPIRKSRQAPRATE